MCIFHLGSIFKHFHPCGQHFEAIRLQGFIAVLQRILQTHYICDCYLNY